MFGQFGGAMRGVAKGKLVPLSCLFLAIFLSGCGEEVRSQTPPSSEGAWNGSTTTGTATVGSWIGNTRYALNVWGNVGIKAGSNDTGYYFEDGSGTQLASLRQDISGNILLNQTQDTQSFYNYIEGSTVGLSGMRWSSKSTGMEMYLPLTIDVGTQSVSDTNLFTIKKSSVQKFRFQNENSGPTLQFIGEVTSDPVPPSANSATLFLKDNAGKTQLYVQFSSGAAQLLATQP
jgi:hypothetical protein